MENPINISQRAEQPSPQGNSRATKHASLTSDNTCVWSYHPRSKGTGQVNKQVQTTCNETVAMEKHYYTGGLYQNGGMRKHALRRISQTLSCQTCRRSQATQISASDQYITTMKVS